MAVVTLLTIDIYLPGGLIEGTHDLANARTAGFTVLVFAQLFNCFNARSETTSAFRAPVRQPVAVGRDRAVGAAAGGGRQPRLPQRRLRHGAAGRSTSGSLCAAMASVVLWFSELRKLVGHAWARRDSASTGATSNSRGIIS